MNSGCCENDDLLKGTDIKSKFFNKKGCTDEISELPMPVKLKK